MGAEEAHGRVRHRCGGRAARKVVVAPLLAAGAVETAVPASEKLGGVAARDVAIPIPHCPSDLEKQGPVVAMAEVAPAPEALAAPTEANVASTGAATADSRATVALCEATGEVAADEALRSPREGQQLEAAPQVEDSALVKARKERHVHFDDDESTWFHITPYAEVYGVHPRLFDFDKNYYMVPSLGINPSALALRALDEEEDDEEDSDTDLEEGWYEVLDPSLFDDDVPVAQDSAESSLAGIQVLTLS